MAELTIPLRGDVTFDLPSFFSPAMERDHEPTVLADVPIDADIFWEETFGPVLTVAPVADLQTAIELANRSRYGLDSAVFTANLEAALRAARALECGQVTINDAPAHGVGSPSVVASPTLASAGRASAIRSTSARS